MLTAVMAALFLAQAVTLPEADKLYAAGRYEDAARHYRELLAADPADPAISLRLGAALMSLNRAAEAVPHLETAEKAAPENPAVLQALGQAYYAGGRLADAAIRFRGLLSLRPGDAAILLRLGACQYQLGEYEEAARSFRGSLEQRPDNVRALAGLGMAWNAMGRPGDARPVLEKALALQPEDRSVRLALGRAYSELGEFFKAEDLLRVLTAEDPDDSEAWFFLGAALFENAYHAPALEALDASLKGRPGYAPALIYRARALANLGRLVEAEAAYTSLGGSPVADRWEFLLGYAEFAFLQNRLPLALEKIETALDANPESGVLHYWKARILLHLDNYTEAEAAALRSVSLSPDLRQPRSLLVRIHRMQGQPEKAAKYIEWLREREQSVALGRGR